MPRLLSRVLVGLPLVMIFGLPARAAQPSLGEQLLPKTTKGVVLVSNVQQLTKQWEQTQLGKLMDEPEMEPFVKDLRRQFQDRFSRLRERLGVTLDDLRGVPSGELDFAVVQPAKDQAAVALLIDVKGHLPQARELLEKVTANLTAQGGKRTPYEIPGVTLLVFDMPAAGEDPESQVAWFLHEEDSLLGAADNLEVVKDIFQRKAGKGEKGDTLGDVEAFRQVMARCQKHAGPAEPQVRWFVEPLGYMETVRTFTPPERRRKGTTIIDVFRDEGFSAIQGVGGYVDLKVQYNGAAYEILH
ncbi:MAG TPA: hypothetical protein VJL29_10260, partial [Thermoguttaceae bacterium]|nr:hypothetical protein [Thermoguttaceae bacterium]